MKFAFDISDVIPKPVTVLSANDIPTRPDRFDKLLSIINDLGYASARAQLLRAPITSLPKLKANPDQRMYILREDNQVIKQYQSGTSCQELQYFSSQGLPGYKDLTKYGQYSIVGYIKVGVKTLFITDALHRKVEISPLCVLDFFVDEGLQRLGYGKRLFDFMLSLEVISPKMLAYDRPSNKFLSFLKKHYGLHKYIPQNNNFVVFKDYGLEYMEVDSKGRPKLQQTARPKTPPITRTEGIAKRFQGLKITKVTEKVPGGTVDPPSVPKEPDIAPATEVFEAPKQEPALRPSPNLEPSLEIAPKSTEPVTNSLQIPKEVLKPKTPEKAKPNPFELHNEAFFEQNYLPTKERHTRKARYGVEIEPFRGEFNWQEPSNQGTVYANRHTLYITKPAAIEKQFKLEDKRFQPIEEPPRPMQSNIAAGMPSAYKDTRLLKHQNRYKTMVTHITTNNPR